MVFLKSTFDNEMLFYDHELLSKRERQVLFWGWGGSQSTGF